MMIVGQEKPPLEELSHHGIKGMRWGRRRKRHMPNNNSDQRQSLPTLSRSRKIRDTTGRVADSAKKKLRSAKVKKTATVVGTALMAAAVVAGTAYIAREMRKKGDTELFSKNSRDAEVFTQKGESFVDKLFSAEPTDIIHATRSRTKGFQFRAKGGLSDPFMEWSKNDDGSSMGPAFLRYGDRNEKVVGTFLDPLGRKDQAGRVIPHTVILPEHLSKNVHNADDLFNKAWDLIKDDFDKFYDA